MWEILLKAIPFTPLLYWLFSKTFRMAKKRKFYEAQIRVLEDYINNYYNQSSIEFSIRDLKARQVTCNDYVGAKFLDYAISKKCPNIFGAVNDFDKAWFLVSLEDIEKNVKLVSKYKKNTLQKFLHFLVYTYLGFALLLFANKFALTLLSSFGFSGIPTPSSFYNFILFISVSALVLSSIILVTIGRSVASTLALSNKLPIEFKVN